MENKFGRFVLEPEDIRNDRPFIFYNMLTSVDGKITGEYFSSASAEAGLSAYNEMHLYYNPKAWIIGRISAEENFTKFKKPELDTSAAPLPYEDYAAVNPDEAESFVVAVDSSGKLGWEKNTLEYAGRPTAHVIEILTEKVDNKYLDFLRRKKISYIFAGETDIDFAEAVKKLKAIFKIDTLKIAGGGILGWSFAEVGLIDELSVLVLPVTDGSSESKTLFERGKKPFVKNVEFKLKSVETVDEDLIWLRYKSIN